MRPYEVMMIFDTGTEPPAIQAVVDRVLETVRSSGGTPGAVDRWGRRPFAYEVKHRREGYYVLVELSGEVQTVHELDRLLTLADEVVRFKVIRLPEKVVRRPTGAPPVPAPAPERSAEPVPVPVAEADGGEADGAAAGDGDGAGDAGDAEPVPEDAPAAATVPGPDDGSTDPDGA